MHLTLDLAGNMRFGPDVEWLETCDPDKVDFSVDPERSARFYPAVRRYWPELADGALYAAYAGVRPKLSGPMCPNSDFLIRGPHDHGVEGLVELYGIRKPRTDLLACHRRVCQIHVGSSVISMPLFGCRADYRGGGRSRGGDRA